MTTLKTVKPFKDISFFSHVYKDVTTNCNLVYANTTGESNAITVGQLMAKDTGIEHGSSTEHVTWIVRFLVFCIDFIRELNALPNSTLSSCMRASYDRTLKKHHTMVMQKAFEVDLPFPPHPFPLWLLVCTPSLTSLLALLYNHRV